MNSTDWNFWHMEEQTEAFANHYQQANWVIDQDRIKKDFMAAISHIPNHLREYLMEKFIDLTGGDQQQGQRA